jgi:hypothetical protein
MALNTWNDLRTLRQERATMQEFSAAIDKLRADETRLIHEAQSITENITKLTANYEAIKANNIGVRKFTLRRLFRYKSWRQEVAAADNAEKFAHRYIESKRENLSHAYNALMANQTKQKNSRLLMDKYDKMIATRGTYHDLDTAEEMMLATVEHEFRAYTSIQLNKMVKDGIIPPDLYQTLCKDRGIAY